MMGTDDTMMATQGSQAAAAPFGDQGDQSVTPQDQAKGAVQVLSQLRESNKAQISAIAEQFPAVSKAAKELTAAFDKALQALIKEIVKTTSTPESAAPRVVR